jgi:hypothetical protein
MTTQPEALRLADALEVDKWHITGVTAQESANELRRLHEVNQELLEALSNLMAGAVAMGWNIERARAAIAKANPHQD